MRSQYSFGVAVELGLDARLPLRVHPRRSRRAIAEGENLEVDPPRRLVQSFNALWSDDVKAEGTSRVTWEIEPVGDSCRLTVTHDQLREGANDELYGGWPMILSGLKTLLETGEKLTTPGSLRYSDATVGLLRRVPTEAPPIVGRRLGHRRLIRLHHAEVVSGHVAEARVEAVRLLGRLLGELDTAALELLERGLHVVRREEEATDGALGEELLDLGARVLLEHRRAPARPSA